MSSSDDARVDPALAAGNRVSLATHRAQHFGWRVERGVGLVTLNRPERKNPLTFASYAELRDLFHTLRHATDVHAVVLAGEGGNFCSGGDVHEIIGPLLQLTAPELLMFTRMTGDLVKAMRALPRSRSSPRSTACVPARARSSRWPPTSASAPRARKTAFLFNRVGLAGCDMGACAMLPRLVGQGRASELLYTGRSLRRRGGRAALGLLQPRWCAPEALLADATGLRGASIAAGPTFANGITKTMLHQEWDDGRSSRRSRPRRRRRRSAC